MNWHDLLSGALPELPRRAGRKVLEALAEALGERARGRGGEALPPLLLILELLGDQLEALSREKLRADEHLRRITAAVDERQRRAALREVLEQLGRGLTLAEDLRALGRSLDGGAVRDRLLLRQHQLRQPCELLARVALTLDPTEVSPDVARRWLRIARALALEPSEPWVLRAPLVELMGRMCQRVGPEVEALWQELLSLSVSHGEDPWVQAAALTTYVKLRAHSAQDQEAILTLVLLPEGAGRGLLPPDHLFVRARAVELAAELGLWTPLRALLRSGEGSEHVLITAARSLASSEDPDAQHLLDGWLGEAAGSLPPRVVAAAVVAAMPTPERPAQALVWVDRVAWALRPEGDPWIAGLVLQALLDRRPELASGPDGVQALERRVGEALAWWSSLLSDGDLAQLAATLRRWLAVQGSPPLRQAHEELIRWLSESFEGDTRDFFNGPLAQLSPEELLEVMRLVAADHYDLGADPLPPRGGGAGKRGGYRIYNGARPALAWWRLAHELTHPRVGKRQAHSHVTDRLPSGRMVALSGRMAEVSPTAVPGQRCASPTRLSWGAELPLPALLPSAARYGVVEVGTPLHRYSLRRAGSRLAGALSAQLSYARVSSEREQALRRPGHDGLSRYDAQLAREGFEVVRPPPPAALLALPSLDLSSALGHLASSDGNTLPHLAAVSIGMATYLMGRSFLLQRQINAERRQIPLVIGGWGSRGKSGSERLKAGLFHGLGYRVLSKTTGCEAMVISSIPGGEPTEIFLYRPYDKATIWEQRAVVKLAVQMDTQVLLWECMALNPDYVQLLQRDWMRDDLSTLTNTYPDHEDIQGPTGRDVADVISLFTPHHSQLITTEQHFLPVLEERARIHQSRFLPCRVEEWSLLPADLLARFPYAEHPRNIAMIAQLAQRLGVRRDEALRAMADHVVPDLGVLKEFGPLVWRDRTMTFVNGMSANERAGFISNWDRMGLDSYTWRAGLTEWVTVVVNNRYDRLARQAAFARIAANDAPADALVVIGTNVGPYMVDYQQALATTLRAHLMDVFTHGRPDGWALLRAELSRRLRRQPLAREEALARLGEVFQELDQEELNTKAMAFYDLDRPLKALCEGLVLQPGAAAAIQEISRRDAALQWLREVSWLWQLGQRPAPGSAEEVVDGFTALLLSRATPLMDPALTGDQVLTRIARRCPPGARLRILGCQNIKGTGLDFVYRWISGQKVKEWLEQLPAAPRPRARELLQRLALHEGYGVVDAQMAQLTLAGLEERLSSLELASELRATWSRVDQVYRSRLGALEEGGQVSPVQGLFRAIEPLLDVFDSIWRRRRADQLYRDLVHRRVSQEGAATGAKALTERQKGGWLRPRWSGRAPTGRVGLLLLTLLQTGCAQGCLPLPEPDPGPEAPQTQAVGAGQLEEEVRRAYSPGATQGSFLLPSEAQVDAMRLLVTRLCQAMEDERPEIAAEGLRDLAAELGFSLVSGEEQGAVWWILKEQGEGRGRGFYAFRQAPAQGAVTLQVPHARNDKFTELLGARCFLEGGVSTLQVSTVSRRTVPASGDGPPPSDLAHTQGSFFHGATRGIVEHQAQARVIQLHGFEDRPGRQAGRYQIILSGGAREVDPRVADLARALERVVGEGEVAVFGSEVDELGGTTNAQGRMVQRTAGALFVHVELSLPFRQRLLSDGELRRRWCRALAMP